jgi:hypothetical protein
MVVAELKVVELLVAGLDEVRPAVKVVIRPTKIMTTSRRMTSSGASHSLNRCGCLRSGIGGPGWPADFGLESKIGPSCQPLISDAVAAGSAVASVGLVSVDAADAADAAAGAGPADAPDI